MTDRAVDESLTAVQMLWHRTSRADRRAARLADAHYSRQTIGARQFAMPGRLLVLLTPEADALWASQWPYAQYVRRPQFKDAWLCTLFRREPQCPYRASDLITQAIAATRDHWGEPPASGMITFVDPRRVRHKRDPGRCFRRAGFAPAGETAKGLLILQLEPAAMPPALPAWGRQLALLEEEEERG